MAASKELKYEIINHIGVISELSGGWNVELNRISWNGGEPKYDLRSWSADHQKMGKGVTLTEDALRSLHKVIAEEIAFLDSDD